MTEEAVPMQSIKPKNEAVDEVIRTQETRDQKQGLSIALLHQSVQLERKKGWSMIGESLKSALPWGIGGFVFGGLIAWISKGGKCKS